MNSSSYYEQTINLMCLCILSKVSFEVFFLTCKKKDENMRFGGSKDRYEKVSAKSRWGALWQVVRRNSNEERKGEGRRGRECQVMMEGSQI